MSTSPPNRARLLLAAACCAMVGGACAQESRLSPSVFLGYVHDSNVFRVSGEEAQALLGSDERSDGILQYGAGLELRLPVSRQLLEFDLDAIRSQYDRFGFLDHTAVNARARWGWRYGRLWSGDLRLRYRQDIASFEEFRQAAKDERTLYEIHAGATRRLALNWDLGMALAHTEFEHDLPRRQTLNRSINLAMAELVLVGSGESRSRAGFRAQTRWVSFPNRETVAATAVDNSHVEYELSTYADWEASYRSQLTGKVGYAMLRHDEFSVRDFSGLTALASYRYRFTGRTGIEASAWRDINVRTDTDASYVRDTGYGLRPYWEYSDRTTFDAFISLQDRRFEGDPRLGVAELDTRQDTTDLAEISVAWAQYENLVYRLAYRLERRDSNQSDRDYRYHTVAGNVRLAF